ncbi:MAG: serine/threonine-protein kinase [Gemmatimonadaceae bacterium]
MTTFEEQLQDALSSAYDIERELGGGGMSRVFVAIEKSLGRKVVIKLLSPELTAEVNRGRFRREIQVAAQLQHPHIVTLLSAGEYGDLVYYTMPFIRGESLKSVIEKDGPMPIEDVVRVLYDVIDALSYAHENGVVHRDIKPANILTSGSHALVTDFGVAKALNAAMASGGGMTSTGMAIGTPAYMSPEQLAGDPAADHRIDIYAVGLLAYELLAGKSPFSGKNPRDVLAAVLTREPPALSEVRPDVPARLSELVMSCLAKDPDARPASAGALMATLDLFATSSGEIRTREHRVPTPGSTGSITTRVVTPVTLAEAPAMTDPLAGAVSDAVSSEGPPAMSGSTAVPGDLSSEMLGASRTPVADGTSPDELATYEPSRPGKRRTSAVIGGLAFLVLVIAGVIFLRKNTDQPPPPTAALGVPLGSPVDTAVTDSAAVAPAAIVPAPTLPVASADSQALVDSTKARARAARAAKADSVKRASVAAAAAMVARGDSLRQTAQKQSRVGVARQAAAGVLGNAEARKNFLRGATRSGGLLGAQRKGDLQTQLDALQPFLRSAGLTYDEFKQLVQQSGVNMFDQFGRIVPDSLQRFASGN